MIKDSKGHDATNLRDMVEKIRDNALNIQGPCFKKSEGHVIKKPKGHVFKNLRAMLLKSLRAML